MVYDFRSLKENFSNKYLDNSGNIPWGVFLQFRIILFFLISLLHPLQNPK